MIGQKFKISKVAEYPSETGIDLGNTNSLSFEKGIKRILMNKTEINPLEVFTVWLFLCVYQLF